MFKAADAIEQAEGGAGDDQAAAAGADEGQGEAFGGDGDGGDGHVDGGLEANHGGDAEGEHSAEAVAFLLDGLPGDVNDAEIKDGGEKRAEQA